MRGIPHFLGEDVAGVDLAGDVCDEDLADLLVFPHLVLAEVDVLCAFGRDRCRPLDAGLAVIVDGGAGRTFSHAEVVGDMLDGLECLDTLVGSFDFGLAGAESRLILADGDRHAIGPPERQTRRPESERNLNSSSGVPSLTALPNWPPQQASLEAVSSWHSDGEGGVASLYASLS